VKHFGGSFEDQPMFAKVLRDTETVWPRSYYFMPGSGGQEKNLGFEVRKTFSEPESLRGKSHFAIY
jgi:hypothetical protein